MWEGGEDRSGRRVALVGVPVIEYVRRDASPVGPLGPTVSAEGGRVPLFRQQDPVSGTMGESSPARSGGTKQPTAVRPREGGERA